MHIFVSRPQGIKAYDDTNAKKPQNPYPQPHDLLMHVIDAICINYQRKTYRLVIPPNVVRYNGAYCPPAIAGVLLYVVKSLAATHFKIGHP